MIFPPTTSDSHPSAEIPIRNLEPQSLQLVPSPHPLLLAFQSQNTLLSSPPPVSPNHPTRHYRRQSHSQSPRHLQQGISPSPSFPIIAYSYPYPPECLSASFHPPTAHCLPFLDPVCVQHLFDPAFVPTYPYDLSHRVRHSLMSVIWKLSRHLIFPS